MSKLITYILFIFLVLGTFPSSLHAETSPQLPVKEDRSDVTPRTYDNDFKERYDSSEYIYEQEKSDGWFTRLIDWLEKTLQSIFDFETQQGASNFLGSLKNIFYIIVIILVVFFIVRAVMNGEGRWVFGKRSDKKIIKHEDIETNIHIIDFNKLISEAIANHDYRLAIRYQYLNMLKKMSASELISYDPDKTNLEYSYEIKNDSVRDQFQYTSYLYNYIWYGEFSIDSTQYEKAQASFRSMLKNIAL